MDGGPYRKSKLKLTLDEVIERVKSLIRINPKIHKNLKRTDEFPNVAESPYSKFDQLLVALAGEVSELPDNEQLQSAIVEIESTFEIENNKYYQRAQNNPETLDNFIVMPGPGISKLLVGKKRIHYGYCWEDAHLKLQKKKFYMPTLKQFVDFVNLVGSGNAYDGTGAKVTDSESAYILEELLENHESGEWLDAQFTRKNQWIYLNQNHRYEGYGISTWNSTPLKQNCLLYESLLYDTLAHSFCYANVFGSANSQGMPTDHGYIRFYGPIEAEPTVTVFGNWGEPTLICTANPEVKLPSIGVRPVKLKLD